MRAQGLPLETIVLGALAVLVLVILAAVFIPGVGNMFRSIFGLAPDAYSNCQTTCTALSNKYNAESTALAAAQNGAYCDDPVTTDSATETCSDYIGPCTITLTGGDVIVINETGGSAQGVDYNC